MVETREIEGVDYFTPTHKARTSRPGREALVKAGRMTETQAVRRESSRGVRVSKWEARQFIGWDGEGITGSDGVHRYVILANSVGGYIVNPDGIPTAECFDLFLDTAREYPNATHVIFAGGYDINMILFGSGDFLPHHAKIVADTGRVTIRCNGRRFKMVYHPRHTFSLTEEGPWDPVKRKTLKLAKFMLWDVFGSFQASFVKACNRTLEDSQLEDLAMIEEMKEKRGAFTNDDIPRMLTYCFAELRCLVLLCESDRDSFEAAGFTATRWDGAGAKASAVLKAKGIAAHKGATPATIREPIQYAYAGGRIEQYRFGDFSGESYTVDIRSAYPWAATLLPSLNDGQWSRVVGKDLHSGPATADEFSLWHVTYTANDIRGLHPFFWRSREGNIFYPPVTTGWYWGPEVYMAMRYAPGTVTIHRGFKFRAATDEKPFGFIPPLFDIRRKLEASRKGRGWPLKLALNSLYGKLAQQIGAQDGKAPRWHQLEWAGWITSRCRAKMYEIASANLDSLVSIQTDGITLLGSPSEALLAMSGGKLGDLEIEYFTGVTSVQSGIYWLRDMDGEWLAPKVRGIGANVLDRDLFLQAWSDPELPAVPVLVERFRGMVTSAVGDRWDEWCRWIKEPRDIAVRPQGKRIHLQGACAACDGSGSMHETVSTGGGGHSELHSLSWVDTVGRTTSDEWWLDTLTEQDNDYDG